MSARLPPWPPGAAGGRPSVDSNGRVPSRPRLDLDLDHPFVANLVEHGKQRDSVGLEVRADFRGARARVLLPVGDDLLRGGSRATPHLDHRRPSVQPQLTWKPRCSSGSQARG